MSGRPRDARDERGWRVPQTASRAFHIYRLMRAGVKPRDIAYAFGIDKDVVRVTAWRIRNPDRANAASAIYRNAHYRRWRDEQRGAQ